MKWTSEKHKEGYYVTVNTPTEKEASPVEDSEVAPGLCFRVLCVEEPPIEN